MSDVFYQHTPVLLQETVAKLVGSPQGTYVDATFGRGSHSQAILNRLNSAGRVIAFDKDPEAVHYAKKQFANEKRFEIVHCSFTAMRNILADKHLLGEVEGVLFDLGVSSPQLDTPERGFSFSREGALDMRMDTTTGVSAAEWLKQIDEQTLAEVLWLYGEEKFSRRIARAIVIAREEAPIETTSQLSKIIIGAVPKTKLTKHPATRCFQAIRIVINQELVELELGLSQALEILKVGGRFAVISFHSLEDRIVKQFIKQHERGNEVPRRLPIKAAHFKPRLKAVGKPIKPSLNEIHFNPRSRSAILRIAEKLL